MDEERLRAGIRDALQTLDASTDAALRRELARLVGRTVDEALCFEVSADGYRVTLVETEEEIVADFAVYDAVPRELRDAAEAADVDILVALEAVVLPWLAERWAAVDGPRAWPGASAFFHEDWSRRHYDLETRAWRKGHAGPRGG